MIITVNIRAPLLLWYDYKIVESDIKCEENKIGHLNFLQY